MTHNGPEGLNEDSSFRERIARKRDHLCIASAAEDGPLSTGFSDVHLIHRAVPDVALPDMGLNTSIWGREVSSPFFIDAITGGPQLSREVNLSLAKAAQEAGWGIAVGSQSAGLEKPTTNNSFEVIRQYHREGPVFANLSAINASVSDAKQAVDMVDADILQLHLNVTQELLMPEGDRHFRGIYQNLVDICCAVDRPVIVKEVGFGISKEIAGKLVECGVDGINVAGAGGTNFASIEMQRSNIDPINEDDYLRWGIPTVSSLAETLFAIERTPVKIVASGGIRSPLDALKALVLGADMVAIAGPPLKIIFEDGVDNLISYLQRWNEDLKRFMIMIDASDIEKMSQLPYVITGPTKDFLAARQIPTSRT